jgi:hypothetical protein
MHFLSPPANLICTGNVKFHTQVICPVHCNLFYLLVCCLSFLFDPDDGASHDTSTAPEDSIPPYNHHHENLNTHAVTSFILLWNKLHITKFLVTQHPTSFIQGSNIFLSIFTCRLRLNHWLQWLCGLRHQLSLPAQTL